jgi:amidase
MSASTSRVAFAGARLTRGARARGSRRPSPGRPLATRSSAAALDDAAPPTPSCFVDHCGVFAAREGAPGGPLSGLTFSAKDNLDVAGVRTGCGSPRWLETSGSTPASSNAAAVEAMLDAGATLVGKTHMDELAWALTGENAHYGTPPNPAAPGRVPGGSSSGAAASVASGACDVALGTDTAGSVRVPASYCGVFGFRPSTGAVSNDGCVPLAASFDVVGCFAKDAATLEKAGNVLLGTNDGEEDETTRRLLRVRGSSERGEGSSDPTSDAASRMLGVPPARRTAPLRVGRAEPSRPETKGAPPTGLSRCVVAADAFEACEPATRAALFDLLRRAGTSDHPTVRTMFASERVAEARLGGTTTANGAALFRRRASVSGEEDEDPETTVAVPPLSEWWSSFRVAQSREVWAAHGAWVRSSGALDSFGPGVRDRFAAASATDADAAAAAESTLDAIAARLETLLDDGVVLLLPTAPGPAPKPASESTKKEAEAYRNAQLRLTTAAGCAGAPQVTIPAARADGMPVGLSLVAARGADRELLALTRELCEGNGGLMALREETGGM